MMGNGGPAAAGGVDEQIFDGLAALIPELIGQAEQVARQLGVPPFFLKALLLLEGPTAMKDLSQRMRCDPSFVTSIADLMEERGLATREPDPADRRVRRLALTAAGLDCRRRAHEELMRRMPWRRSLDAGERACLLALVRKMLAPPGAAAAGATLPEEVGAPAAPCARS